MPNAKTRKRPCRVCGRWFLPDVRCRSRQKTCGSLDCQNEWKAVVRGRATLTNTYHLKKRLFYVSKQGNIRFFKAEKRNIGTKILASKSKKTPVPDRLRKKLKQWKCEWGQVYV
jgi:hypothetical protein